MTDKNGKNLCNFFPYVERVEDVIENEEIVSTNIYIQLRFDNKQCSKVFPVRHSELDKLRWQDLDERGRFNPEVPLSKAQRYLADSVWEQLLAAPRNKVFQLTKTGLSKVDGESVYCAGEKVILSLTKALPSFKVESQLQTTHLDIDDEISEAEAASEIFGLIALSHTSGQIMLAYKLLWLMRQAYMDVGMRPNFCLHLYGKTGTQKTTFSTFLMQLYNRKSGITNPPRLDASIAAAVKILQGVTDDVIVFDDLYPAKSDRIRHQQEETWIEIIRYIADGTVPARMNGQKLSTNLPQCGVIFTGEYVIGERSDAARFLSVEMRQPDGIKLNHFQQHPLTVSTFYYFFLTWFISNYDDIVKILKEWTDYNRATKLGVHDRLQEVYYFLRTAYGILLQYCFDKKILSEEVAHKLYSSFNCSLLQLVRQQNQRVGFGNMPGKVVSTDYFTCLRSLYKDGKLSIAPNINKFNQNLHNGLIYDNRLYIRRKAFSIFFPQDNVDEIITTLLDEGILEKGINKHSKQISKLNGMRFYVIPLKHLK